MKREGIEHRKYLECHVICLRLLLLLLLSFLRCISLSLSVILPDAGKEKMLKCENGR